MIRREGEELYDRVAWKWNLVSSVMWSAKVEPVRALSEDLFRSQHAKGMIGLRFENDATCDHVEVYRL